MALQIPTRAKMTSTTTGTGTLTLAASADASLRSFQSAFGAGPIVVEYMIAGVGLYEYGVGTFTSPTTLSRTTIKASSNGGAAVSLPVGTVDVFAVWHAGAAAVDVFSGAKTQALADAGNNQVFTGGSSQNYTLLSRALVHLNFEQFIINSGTATFTLVRNGADTINGAAANFPLLAGGSGVLSLGAAGDWRFDGISYPDLARTSQANTFTADQVIQSTDAGASAGPTLDLDRNSASPAASDTLGQLNFRGRSSTGVSRRFANIYASIISATNAAENGILHLAAIVSGTLTDALLLAVGIYTPNATGGDKGADTINSKGYYLDGTVLPVVKSSTSTDRTITAAALITFAHGLGVAPKLIRLSLVAQSSVDGYNSGDVVEMHPGLIAGAENRGFAVVSDATNVTVRVGANGNSFDVMDGSAGTSVAATNSNYKMRITAFA